MSTGSIASNICVSCARRNEESDKLQFVVKALTTAGWGRNLKHYTG